MADWVVRQRLLTIPGVSQIIVMGGERKQFQVLVDPNELVRYGVTLHEVETALRESNQNTAGGYLDQQGPNEFLVRSLGRIKIVDEISGIVVTYREGQSITLSQVARIVEGPQVKRGDSSAFARTADGTFDGGPAVVLTINKQPSADTREVTEQCRQGAGGTQGFAAAGRANSPRPLPAKDVHRPSDRECHRSAPRRRHPGRDHSRSLPDELPNDVHHADGDSAVDRDDGA